MNLDEIQQIFFQECEEGLVGMEANFAALKAGDRDSETINAVFRCVHSVKGGAGAFGHDRLQAFTHQYETLLDKIRNRTIELSPDLLDLLMGAYDLLSDHVAAARDNSDAPSDAAMLERLAAAAGGSHQPAAAPAAPAPVATTPVAQEPAAPVASAADDLDDLMAMLGDAPPAEAEAEPNDEPTTGGWHLTYQPTADALDNGAEPLLLLRELAMLGGRVTSCDVSTLPPLGDIEPERAYFSWSVALPAEVAEDDIRGVFEFTDACAITLTRDAGQAESAVEPAAELDLPDFESLLAPVSSAPEPVVEPLPAPVAIAPEPAPVEVIPEPAPVREAPPAPPALVKHAPAPAAAKSETATNVSQTIRVDLDKLDRMVNLVGELVITQAMLAQRLSEKDMAGMPEVTDLEHLTRELQESTMAIRAQPMKTVFSRVPRIIRELEGETGKRVRLEVEGEMTEVDKTVVERIGEPLTHLIRNAVDHGLEAPEDRVAAGKPAEGVVRLSAAHQSGRIVITVSDDGKGIDRARVRAKAIEKGIIAPDATMSDEDVDNLIFAPGFSTAAKVSNVSGRGVGMDVVRKNVQALGGRIGIQSCEGSGSSFSLSLPLTLAVLDGMVVTVGSQTLVIPLSHIVESLRPGDRVLSPFGPTRTLLDVRGAYVPVFSLADDLGITGAERDPTKAVLIVVETDQGQAALLVDTIQDQRQVVVKSLEANYQAVDGVAGATILGDGRVALIVDVDTLIERGRATANTLTAEAA